MQTFLDGLMSGLLNALPHILWALVAFFIGLWIANAISALVLRALQHSKVDATVHTFLSASVKIFILIIAILTAASILGIPITSILTLLGGAVVAIGLAVKDSLSNFASGLILLFTHPFKVGDYIETNNTGGTVERIDLMFTVLTAPDNKSIILPNSKLIGDKVTNYSAYDTRRISIAVVVPFSADIASVRQVLLTRISRAEGVLSVPSPCVGPEKFTDNGVQLSVMAWCERGKYWDVFYDLHEQIKSALDQINVPIAISTLEVQKRNVPTDTGK